MADNPYAPAIASVESGGSSDPYRLLGPATKKGDRAHGKYQVMGNNIGPWSKEILGREISKQEFLGSPELQDQIFNGKFNQYVDKYGPEGASRAWFAGPGGMNNPNATDVLGTSVEGYGKKFMAALGQQQPQSADASQPAAPPQYLAQAQPPQQQSVPQQLMQPLQSLLPQQLQSMLQPQAQQPQQSQQSPQQQPQQSQSPQMPAYAWSPQAQQPPGYTTGAPPQLTAPPPLQLPQMRRPPDLNALRTLLAQAPASVRGLIS